MAVTADIQINGSPGSNDNLPLGVLVNLSNVSATTPTTYEWAILSQPEGTTTNALSNVNSATPTFTPTKEGSYLIRLIVDKTLPTEATQQVIAAVLELETLNRIPAAGETVENDGNTGWANTAVDYVLQRTTRLTDSGVIVGQAGAAGLTAGSILRATGVQTIGIDTANQRVVPVFTAINATTAAVQRPELVVLLGGVNGNPAPGSGSLIRVRYTGLFQGVVYPSGAPSVGDPVYVSDVGTISLTVGTVPRPCGTVAAVDTGAGTYDVFFGGGISSAGTSTPTGPAGGVLGYPGSGTLGLAASTYPNPTGLAPVIDVSNQKAVIPIANAVNGQGVQFRLDPFNNPVSAKGDLEWRGASNSGGDGGAVKVYAGSSTAVGGDGGFLLLQSGDGETAGQVYINPGYTYPDNGNDGAVVNITGGNGSFSLSGPTAPGLGGSVIVKGGVGGTSYSTGPYRGGTGGTALLRGGDGGLNGGAGKGDGGVAGIVGGFGRSGGSAAMYGGEADAGFTCGSVILYGGFSNAGTPGVTPGAVVAIGGQGGPATALIAATAGGGFGAAGGPGGAASAALAGGVGGTIIIGGGAGGAASSAIGGAAGGAGGSVTIVGGAGGAGSTVGAGLVGNGGDITVAGGAHGTGGLTETSGKASGAATFRGGDATGNAAPGAVVVRGGNTTGTVNGGPASVTGGSTSSGTGGAASLTGGASTSGNGGAVTITGGAGVIGGAVTIDSGAGSSTGAVITIGGANATGVNLGRNGQNTAVIGRFSLQSSGTATTIAAGSALTFNRSLVEINSAGAVTFAGTIAAGNNGQVVMLVNTGVNTITFQNGTPSNLVVTNPSVAIGANGTLMLVYVTAVAKWFEISHKN